ncbi:dihydropteroate synthase [Kwoniella heveanensis CBS 569]|nr:dihydropteroate synthase [Kwoniella heveanensis CBS 569]
MPPDSVNLTSLSIHLPNGLGPSAFNLTDPAPPCPIYLSLNIQLREHSIQDTASGDSMSGLGVNYSAVSKAIYAHISVPDRKWADPWELMRAAAKIPLDLDDVEKVVVELEMPKALLHAAAAIYEATYARPDTRPPSSSSRNAEYTLNEQKCTIRDIRTECLIGLHPHERGEKQRMEADVSIQGIEWGIWAHKAFADEVYKYVAESTYGTIESLIHELGRYLYSLPILSQSSTSKIELTLRKPSAIPYAIPSISIYRSASDYPLPSQKASESSTSATDAGPSTSRKRVFIAVGSNIGDRVQNISRAIKMLEENGCELVGCSRLYESEPMYVEDQDRFVNGAIEISTTLPPLDLLRLLKRTEKTIGRTKTFTNGPRVIDLDLVFYGTEKVKIGSKDDEEDADGVRWLECPHASLAEREFVLRPIADIASEFRHPSLGLTVQRLLDRLPKSDPPALQPIIPFHSAARPVRLSTPATPHIMAIFNATPDSFSDGDENRTEVSYALSACERLVAGTFPPAILDIGGMSTRPRSQPCTEQEELSRVVPLVQAIRGSSIPRLREIPISIDTYRPNVARAAIEAGASCINDVRGGREPGMMEVMAQLDVPVVLMHSRGDSTSMTTAEAQDYSTHGGVIEGVIAELADTVDRALKAGVRRWNIILDPGLGFAKTQEDNLRLLRRLPELVHQKSSSSPSLRSSLAGYPLLVGGSRKGFVGRVIEREIASERGYGDTALNTACALSGVVDVLRVHEARAAGESVKMACAIRDA